MHLFKQKTYHWWQIGLLKVAMLAIGIAIGANWPEVWASHTTTLIVLGIVLGLYLLGVWIKK